jgi:hypothetical protein
MSRSTLIIVTVVVIAASAAIVGWSFFGLGISPAPSKTQVSTNQATQSAAVKGFPRVPMDIQNPAVIGAQVYYTLRGTIKEIKPYPKSLVLITDISVNKIPKLVVAQNTKVNRVSNGKTTLVPSYELKPNQKVEIKVSYGLKRKAWFDITYVNILADSTTVATSSATSQTQ